LGWWGGWAVRSAHVHATDYHVPVVVMTVVSVVVIVILPIVTVMVVVFVNILMCYSWPFTVIVIIASISSSGFILFFSVLISGIGISP
jgi:hypothetical protein